MKSVKGKKGKDITKPDNQFIIPRHWIEAAKVAKQVWTAFGNQVSLNDFLEWNQYTRFQHFVCKKQPIYIVIRHTKKWLAECLTNFGDSQDPSGYIKINIDDVTVGDSDGNITIDSFNNVLRGTLIHELIHFFQESLGLEKQLSPRERKKLVLCGNKFDTLRNSFLYSTNWVEMDAELGSYCIQHNFHIPTLDELIAYFREWYADDALSSAIGTYIYNYFIEGKKELKFREQVFRNEVQIA